MLTRLEKWQDLVPTKKLRDLAWKKLYIQVDLPTITAVLHYSGYCDQSEAGYLFKKQSLPCVA